MKNLLTIALMSAILIFSEAQVIPGFPECNPGIVTWHPHPLSCTKYVLCYHGNPIERLCAPGLHFSSIYEQCMFPQLARCDVNYACPSVDDTLNPVFLPDGNDCSRYFVCFEGSPIARDCATSLWWDVVYNWCTVADEVSCDSRVPNNPKPPTSTENPQTDPPTQPPTEPPTESPTNPPTEPPTEVPSLAPTLPTTTQNPNTYDCPLSSDPSFHPHTRECDLYFICINGVAFLRQCAPGMLFDILNRECDDQETATCISGANNVDLPNDNNYVRPIFSFVCPLHFNYDILFFPHQSKCERYYVCQKGVAFLHTCAVGQSYDVEKEKCQPTHEAVCLNDL